MREHFEGKRRFSFLIADVHNYVTDNAYCRELSPGDSGVSFCDPERSSSTLPRTEPTLFCCLVIIFEEGNTVHSHSRLSMQARRRQFFSIRKNRNEELPKKTDFE